DRVWHDPYAEAGIGRYARPDGPDLAAGDRHTHGQLSDVRRLGGWLDFERAVQPDQRRVRARDLLCERRQALSQREGVDAVLSALRVWSPILLDAPGHPGRFPPLRRAVRLTDTPRADPGSRRPGHLAPHQAPHLAGHEAQ